MQHQNKIMNRGDVINSAGPFGGACVDVSAGPRAMGRRACVFREGASKHTCQAGPASSLQCGLSRIVRRMYELRDRNVRIVPERVNYVDVMVSIVNGIAEQMTSGGYVTLYNQEVTANIHRKPVAFPPQYRRTLPRNRQATVLYNGYMPHLIRDMAYTLAYEKQLALHVTTTVVCVVVWFCPICGHVKTTEQSSHNRRDRHSIRATYARFNHVSHAAGRLSESESDPTAAEKLRLAHRRAARCACSERPEKATHHVGRRGRRDCGSCECTTS